MTNAEIRIRSALIDCKQQLIRVERVLKRVEPVQFGTAAMEPARGAFIKMKLAEALQERADLNRRIEQLNARLYRNSKVQQGRNPEEDPAELISELDGCISRLEYLIAKINICNCNTKTPDGKSITELIAKRDCLKIKIDAYRDLAGNASSLCDRVTRSEIVILSTVDVRALQKQIDAMSRELRCTDNMIQQLNWLTEIE